jgi:hypothetical protein
MNSALLFSAVATILIFCYRKNLYHLLGKYGSLLEFYAIILGIIFFVYPDWKYYQSFRENLFTINCINNSIAQTFLDVRGQEKFNNDRYYTDFYKNNLSDILYGKSNEEIEDYLGVMIEMDRANLIVDRADGLSANSVINLRHMYVGVNNEVSELASSTRNRFKKLKIDQDHCIKKIFTL